jgi:short-subunit dehydrogenase
MKVSITGNTSGIGLALAEKFNVQDNVIGFSRSNGYDVRYDNTRKKIVSESFDSDIFINNAYHSDGQTLLLGDMLESWQGTNKTIIHISSVIVNMPEEYFLNYPELLEYRRSKLIGNLLIKNYKGTVNILNVMPGIVKTNFFLGKLNPEMTSKGLDPNSVAQSIITSYHNKQKELIINV